MSDKKLGIIGGSGLYNLPGLTLTDEFDLTTPFGKPSDRIVAGTLHRQEIFFLPRHGAGHRHSPSDLPYQANIYALKQLGVTHVLTVSAVGSLREELPPLTVVIPDQIIDRTVSRPRSYFERGAVAHAGLADPYCTNLRAAVIDAARTTQIPVVDGGTYVCIEGPQFSTRAESHMYRTWGADIIGMTAMPEARLAREAELCYATIALVTDFDVWHVSEEAVTVEMVIANLMANTETAKTLLSSVASFGLPDRACSCKDALANAIMTNPEMIPADTRARIGLIADRYLPAAPES